MVLDDPWEGVGPLKGLRPTGWEPLTQRVRAYELYQMWKKQQPSLLCWKKPVTVGGTPANWAGTIQTFAFWETEEGEECTCFHWPCVSGALTNPQVTHASYVLIHTGSSQPYRGGTSVIFVLQVRKLRHGSKGTARSCNNSSQNSMPEELWQPGLEPRLLTTVLHCLPLATGLK